MATFYRVYLNNNKLEQESEDDALNAYLQEEYTSYIRNVKRITTYTYRTVLGLFRKKEYTYMYETFPVVASKDIDGTLRDVISDEIIQISEDGNIEGLSCHRLVVMSQEDVSKYIGKFKELTVEDIERYIENERALKQTKKLELKK